MTRKIQSIYYGFRYIQNYFLIQINFYISPPFGISYVVDWFKQQYLSIGSLSLYRVFYSGVVPLQKQQKIWQFRYPSETETILLFSNRQLIINALFISILVSPQTSRINLPNLLELSFLIVLELPNAYNIQLQPRIFYYMPNTLLFPLFFIAFPAYRMPWRFVFGFIDETLFMFVLLF